jgi:hypothetical protein
VYPRHFRRHVYGIGRLVPGPGDGFLQRDADSVYTSSDRLRQGLIDDGLRVSHAEPGATDNPWSESHGRNFCEGRIKTEIGLRITEADAAGTGRAYRRALPLLQPQAASLPDRKSAAPVVPCARARPPRNYLFSSLCDLAKNKRNDARSILARLVIQNIWHPSLLVGQTQDLQTELRAPFIQTVGV